MMGHQMNNLRKLAFAALLAALGSGVLAQPVYPGADWERHPDPALAGLDADRVRRVKERLETLDTTGMMVVVGGRVAFEYGDTSVLSYLASCRKSILAMLYGRYVEDGTIRLDRTLKDLGMDDRQGLLESEQAATVEHLILARSGVYHPASNGGDDTASAPKRGEQKPGSYYLYNNWDFNAAGAIFEQETGRDLYDALEEHLAIPLGFQDFDRASHRKSGNLNVSMHPAYHMNLSTRDMARVGYLMLREGRWGDTQIVPADWVARSTSLITPRAEMNPPGRRNGAYGYGYMWWVFDNPELPEAYRGGYTGLGAVGQHILVLPALDLVVAHKTVPGDGRSVSHNQFLEVAALLVEARCGAVCR